ncbi:436_t:CDS:2, partial [Entrophospora sp. SA101]
MTDSPSSVQVLNPISVFKVKNYTTMDTHVEILSQKNDFKNDDNNIDDDYSNNEDNIDPTQKDQ